MVRPFRFGRRLTVPSTVEIKHRLMLLWLKDQVAKEAAESTDIRLFTASGGGTVVGEKSDYAAHSV